MDIGMAESENVKKKDMNKKDQRGREKRRKDM